MMLYARIHDGIVAEIINIDLIDGEDVPIESRFTVEFVSSCINITEVHPRPKELWSYNGSEFIAPPDPLHDIELLSVAARKQRDYLLNNIYDKGVMMALRALRIAKTDQEKAYANAKITELDAYAELLIATPQQAGFPKAINWPVAPTE